MQKDLKIGMIVGLVLVCFFLLVYSSRSALNRSSETSSQSQTTPENTSVETGKTKGTRFHIVKTSQTLSDISNEYYGTKNNWLKILNANREIITDADRLRTGTRLVIPD